MFFKSIFSRKKTEASSMELKLEETENWVRKENSDFIAFLESEIKECSGGQPRPTKRS
jgi:hypothetical protein